MLDSIPYCKAVLWGAALLGLTVSVALPGAAASAEPHFAETTSTFASVPASEVNTEAATGIFHREYIIDYHIKPSDSEKWEGRCPISHPYLADDVVSHDFVNSGGVRGFELQRESDWVAIGADYKLFSPEAVPGLPGRKYVTGTGGTLTNWSVTHQWLKLQMVCTSDPNVAYIIY
jgi:hypothetical protein